MLQPQGGTADIQKACVSYVTVSGRGWKDVFTVVDQQGEFVESQGAVRRHAEEGEELAGACGRGRIITVI